MYDRSKLAFAERAKHNPRVWLAALVGTHLHARMLAASEQEMAISTDLRTRITSRAYFSTALHTRPAMGKKPCSTKHYINACKLRVAVVCEENLNGSLHPLLVAMFRRTRFMFGACSCSHAARKTGKRWDATIACAFVSVAG